MSKAAKEANRLIGAESPYLLQHAYNPVDWWPWCQEAFDKAKREDKLVFFSCGYSSCHWCHVMERESFEDEEIAQILNEHYVSVKVDREERPDLDALYQTAAQAISGSAGWPLTVFLTPDKKPVYAGTYFPPEDRYGRPGLKRVLNEVSRIYRQERERLLKSTSSILEVMREDLATVSGGDDIRPDEIESAASSLLHYHDRRHGGFGTAPKFPTVSLLGLFLRLGIRDLDSEYLDVVWFTLEKMAQGGIYDQVGGGFHRYSTDEQWLIPHFEKMLYDNALLVPLYLAGYTVTHRDLFKRVAEETLDWVLREMTSPQGGFYATLDADSDGEEGLFYVWRYDEVLRAVPENADMVLEHFGVTPQGNFEKGTTVLSVVKDVEELSHRTGQPVESIQKILDESRKRLLSHRELRERPFRDEKIICSWNGMAISALAKAGRILKNGMYETAAVNAAEFALRELSFSDGRLRRSFRTRPSDFPGFLEDYAFLSAGLIDLYQATFDAKFLKEAIRLVRLTQDLFWDQSSGAFMTAPKDAGDLLLNPRDAVDQSIPSAASIAARNLVLLRSVIDDIDVSKVLDSFLGTFGSRALHNAWGYSSFLSVADLYLQGPTEVVVVARDKKQAEKLISSIWLYPRPDAVVYFVQDGQRTGGLFADKHAVNGQPTAYVCQGFKCSAPVTDPEELRNIFAGA